MVGLKGTHDEASRHWIIALLLKGSRRGTYLTHAGIELPDQDSLPMVFGGSDAPETVLLPSPNLSIRMALISWAYEPNQDREGEKSMAIQEQHIKEKHTEVYNYENFTRSESGGKSKEFSNSHRVGSEAPDFDLATIEGGHVALSQFRGKKHVLLEFGSIT